MIFEAAEPQVLTAMATVPNMSMTKYTADGKRDTVIDHRGLTTYKWGSCCGKLVRVDNPDESFVEHE